MQEMQEIKETREKIIKYAETGEVVRDMALLKQLKEWGVVVFHSKTGRLKESNLGIWGGLDYTIGGIRHNVSYYMFKEYGFQLKEVYDPIRNHPFLVIQKCNN
ncbi:MAG: hypothetical protein LBP87_00835 [Planctomycetaceae bacterium]|jgi:hypothetical protein|nr:hypothetical protein [Planctomycetaceae bacterium]